jgi:hypothetical protein
MNGTNGALPVENGFADGVKVKPVVDKLTFLPSTAAGTFIVTLPDKLTKVTINVNSNESAMAVATDFQRALLALNNGWTAPVPIDGNVTMSGPTQSGYSNTTSSDVVSGALPRESGIDKGIPILSVKDNITFSPATSPGSIAVTLPDKTTNIIIEVTAGESANQIAMAFRDALVQYNGWTAPVPTDGNVSISGPTQSGYVNSTASGGVSGALPIESGFDPGNPGGVQRDTLTFGPASAPGTMSVTYPNGTKLLVYIDAPMDGGHVASAFSKALPGGWFVTQTLNHVTFNTSGVGGIPTSAVDVNSRITATTIRVTNGIPPRLPSWVSGARTGFIETWGDLESVLQAEGSISIATADAHATDPLNVYFRTDNSDDQDTFSTKALMTNASDGIHSTLTLTGSIPVGVEGEQSMITTCMTDTNGIGFGFMGSVRSYTGAQIFSWNGVNATDQHLIDSVQNFGTSQYPLWNPLILLSTGQPTGDVKTFINWLTDPNNNVALAQTAGFTSLYGPP